MTIQQRFERVLASSRLLALIPVVFLLLDAAGSFIYGADILIRTADGDFGEPSKVGGRLGVFLVVMDTFLVGATLMIAAFGFYELFVLRRERAAHSNWLPSWLQMRDLEDLKARVVSMLILVAAITFVDMLVETHELRGILFLGLGIAVIIVALTAFLRFGRKSPSADDDEEGGTLAIGLPPEPRASPEPPASPEPELAQARRSRRSHRSRITALLSNSVREGDWGIADRCDILAVAGSARLDLREARLDRLFAMRITAILGVVTVVVPPGIRVTDSGVTLLGLRSVSGGSAGPDGSPATVLEITGSSALSRVRVMRGP